VQRTQHMSKHRAFPTAVGLTALACFGLGAMPPLRVHYASAVKSDATSESLVVRSPAVAVAVQTEASMLATAPTFEQRACLSAIQRKLSEPPFDEDLNLVPERMGVSNVALLVSEAARQAVADFEQATGTKIASSDVLLAAYRQVLTAYLVGTRNALEDYW